MDKYIELYNKAKTDELKWEVFRLCYEENRGKSLKAIAPDMKYRALKNKDTDMFQEIMLMMSHWSFDDYMLCLEMNRPAKEKFWEPRRKTLKPIAEALDGLYFGDFDELFISLPPRVGKTTLITFFITWVMGLNNESTNLYSSCSDTNTNSFFRGVQEVIEDDFTYAYKVIFPETHVAHVDSKKGTIDLKRKKKYPTLTCRAIGGTLNGSCDCNGILVSDDLVKGIEEVLSPDRMWKLWQTVDNNLLTRAKESAKTLWIGTRWSMIDPIGIRLDTLENDPTFENVKYKVFNVPALNESDQSNFVYDYKLGFSTEKFLQRRASFERNNDLASWSAQYMQEPVEREGSLFEPGGMKFYNGVLPDEQPVRISAACDVAFGGGDFLSMPVAFVYADDSVYIHDVVYNPGDKKITLPLVVDCIKRNGIQDVDFEKNSGGDQYADSVEERVGRGCTIVRHSAPGNKGKETRIFQAAPDIREWYFLSNGHRSKEYQQFMNNLYSFKVLGKNKHEDAPDSLAQLSVRLERTRGNKAIIFMRPF